MIIQLEEHLSVETPLGHGYAVIFESGEDDNWWTVALDNGAIVTFQQSKVRMSRSYTHERGIDDEKMRGIVSDMATLRSMIIMAPLPLQLKQRVLNLMGLEQISLNELPPEGD